MQENSKDYEFCIKVALNNAKNRINLLDLYMSSLLNDIFTNEPIKFLKEGKITSGHARALIGVKNSDLLAKKIIHYLLKIFLHFDTKYQKILKEIFLYNIPK